MKRSMTFATIGLLVLCAACTSMEKRTKCVLAGAAIGAAAGGGAGAVFGNNVGGHDNEGGEGAIIGAAAGAVVGGAVGYFVCPEEVRDGDQDGVTDDLDKCPATPAGVAVDSVGCALDTDGDGVPDYQDQCPQTPEGMSVNSVGCPGDADGDGVTDDLDKCPATPAGVAVDTVGCPLDSDGDGVYDYLDQCPGTPVGATVNDAGCWVLQHLRFATNKHAITGEMHATLNAVVVVLKKNPDLRVEIGGHTDSMGDAVYNQKLSERRAVAVHDYLVSKGIDADRLTARGYGNPRPIATNDAPEGRARNRRVQLDPIR